MMSCRIALVAGATSVLIAIASCSESLTAPSDAGASSEIVGIASITDGDTIEINGTSIRLSGFDSPERGSLCGSTNVYQRASLALSDFIGSQTVHCAPEWDRDGMGALSRPALLAALIWASTWWLKAGRAIGRALVTALVQTRKRVPAAPIAASGV